MCGAAGQWKPAQDVFEQMLPCGCKPDAVTYGLLISAYDRGNHTAAPHPKGAPLPSPHLKVLRLQRLQQVALEVLQTRHVAREPPRRGGQRAALGCHLLRCLARLLRLRGSTNGVGNGSGNDG